MSIYVYGKIKQRCIDEDLFERFLVDYYSSESNIMKEKNKNRITYEFVNGEDDVIISFMNETKAPYNVYDCNITGNEFEYLQLILFDIRNH